MTLTRARILRNLSNNGGTVLWDNLTNGERASSAWLRDQKLAELRMDDVAYPSVMRLAITDAGRAALGGTTK